MVLERRAGRIMPDRLDAFERGFLALVVLAGGDDLPVRCMQVEMVFTRAALFQDEFSGY
jgi:hypothetical protein